VSDINYLIIESQLNDDILFPVFLNKKNYILINDCNLMYRN